MAAATPSTALVIAESTEAAYRYATQDASEVTIVLAGDDGSVDVTGHYDRVVVVGFTSAPAVLRSVVDHAFDIVTAGGRVLVGGAAGQLATDVTPWTRAFDRVQVVTIDRGSFPSVEVAPGAGSDTGAYILGALSVPGASDPRPDLRAASASATAAAGATAAAHAERSRPADMSGPGKAKSPGPLSMRDQLAAAVARHRRPLVAAGIVAVLALAVSIGLVALLGEYFLAMLSTLTLMVMVAVAVRLEQRNRQVQRQLSRVTSSGDGVKGLRSKLRPAVLLDEVREQRKDISAILKVVGVNQLAIVDAAKVLHALQTRDQDQPTPSSR
ncbi:hypothetical protein [Aeromicrobium sp.]|uniref:hypothetical protein n=1 Tax=Aeromicrobium sp. TaxID=1871063 RepID=UPI0019CE32DE|nr:hypothetical protein [Aeromicrobium sp.]MBC7630239.1 TMEM165/GDT1 family protein [Aeromicrobium sp.]